MRTALRNHAEVCHIWASRSQGSGYSGHINFEGDTIYSYGHWWMAKFVGEDVVFYRDSSYSSSTAAHQNMVLAAIPDTYTVYYAASRTDHAVNIANYLYRLRKIADAFWASNTRAQQVLEKYDSWTAALHSYAEKFNMEVPLLAGLELSGPMAKARLEKQKNKEEKRARVEKKIRSQLQAEAREEIEDLERRWLAGEKVRTSFWKRHRLVRSPIDIGFSQLRLRYIKDTDEIETSGGAFVPAKAAKILYSRMMAGNPVHGFKIGSYTVTGYNGSLKIGCHEVTAEEIERFAKVMSWS